MKQKALCVSSTVEIFSYRYYFQNVFLLNLIERIHWKSLQKIKITAYPKSTEEIWCHLNKHSLWRNLLLFWLMIKNFDDVTTSNILNAALLKTIKILENCHSRSTARYKKFLSSYLCSKNFSIFPVAEIEISDRNIIFLLPSLSVHLFPLSQSAKCISFQLDQHTQIHRWF